MLKYLTYYCFLSQRKPHTEYYVLGCQTLAELKDMLYCPRDYSVAEDYSDYPQRFSWDKVGGAITLMYVFKCVVLITGCVF